MYANGCQMSDADCSSQALHTGGMHVARGRQPFKTLKIGPAPTRSKILGQNSFHPDPFITEFLKDGQHYLTILSLEKLNELVTILLLR